MDIKYLEPLYSVNRVSLSGDTYLRMADLAHEFDAKYELQGVGSALCKLFRQAKAGTFFYMEMNPAQKRGYYMHEDLLDSLVHFAGANHERVRDEMAGKTAITTNAKPTAARAPRRNTFSLATDRFVYPVTAVRGQELGYFLDNGEMWIKVADVARILRPETQLYSVMPTMVRNRGLKIRAVTHPARGTRSSYFVSEGHFKDLCDMLHVGPRSIAVRELKSALLDLMGAEMQVVEALSEKETVSLEELRAMNVMLLNAMNSMMAMFAKQSDEPVKVGV